MENNMANNTSKELFNPIQFDNVHPAIRSLGVRSPEEKLYIVLYTRTDEDSNGFLLCEGRMDCYTSIERLLHTYAIDIHNSVVLVEIPAINKNNEGEWVIKHPNAASTIYQFCKAVEVFFPNIDFNIDDFNDKNVEDENEPVAVTEDDLRVMSSQIANSEDTDVARSYQQFMNERNNNPESFR